MKKLGGMIAALGLAMGVLAPATADEGLVNAVAFRPLPAGATISVRPLDNSPANLDLARRFEEVLAAQGYRLDRAAPLILSFETRDTIGAWSDAGRRTVIELESRGDGIAGDRQRVLLNLFDSASGGLVNEGRGQGTQIVTPTQYRIDATLDDRRNGERLWQGWVTADLVQTTGEALSRAMVEPLARALGRTARREPFTIDQ